MSSSRKGGQNTTRTIGFKGEKIAENYLLQQGLSLVSRNFYCRLGEVDLIMEDGNCLVFVEVRQRKNNSYGSPIETISTTKQRKIRDTAMYYMMVNNTPGQQELRFDVVGILSNGHQGNSIEWIANAF